MLDKLRSLLSGPQPAGPPETVRAFSTADATITQDGVTVEANSWRIESTEGRTVRLFDVHSPGARQCVVTYRAEMKTEGLDGRAYLEMWCSFPGRGEFFSRGLNQTASGTADWTRFETPFYLKKDQSPDLLKLNVVVEGRGVVWLRNIEVLKTPLTA